jgi:hypothetical protein
MTYPIINPFTTKLDITFAHSQYVKLGDHMPHVKTIHINVLGEERYKQNTIIDLFNDLGIEYKDKTFISDHYLLFDDFDKLLVDSQNVFLRLAKEFYRHSPDWKLSLDFLPFTNLTFMSNKIREHRILCSMLLGNLFNSENLAYTYSNYNDNTNHEVVCSELLLGTNYNLDISKKLSDQWFTHDNRYEQSNPFIKRMAYKNNREVFFDCLYDNIFKLSATSIITEPNFYERGSILTEKTLMSIYSGHFMIWAGGWKNAEAAKKIGLDVFDDVIDHSYQYIEHPGKRVVESIIRNFNFLKDINLQQLLRIQHRERFNNNLRLVQDLNMLEENILSLNS